MDFNQYQKSSRKTAIYPGVGTNCIYPALGIASEAGEVAGKIKKFLRDGKLNKTELALELGDCLWYIAQLCTELNMPLDDIASMNIEKLQDRQERDTLQGSGDNR